MGADHPAIAPRLHEAEMQVLKSDGVEVSVRTKGKTLRKFGERHDLGTSLLTVAPMGGEAHEIYVATNAITSIVSSSLTDATETVTIEGHTISGSDFTFVTQSATLTAQTAVTLGTALARISRIYNTAATAIAGDVYAYEGGSIASGVPDDLTKVHAHIEAGEQSTHKAATTISSTDYWFVTDFTADVERNASARVDVHFEIREVGGVFRNVLTSGLSTTGSSTVHLTFDPVIIVPANADVRITAIGSMTGISIAASVSGYLAKVITGWRTA